MLRIHCGWARRVSCAFAFVLLFASSAVRGAVITGITTSSASFQSPSNYSISGYVYVDVDTEKRDIGSYVADAKKAVESQLALKPGYLLTWSGQYEAMARVRERMKVVLPLTLFIVFGLIFMNTKSLPKTMIVLLAVPFSAVGAIWFLYALLVGAVVLFGNAFCVSQNCRAPLT